jgi:hypothetical protein
VDCDASYAGGFANMAICSIRASRLCIRSWRVSLVAEVAVATVDAAMLIAGSGRGRALTGLLTAVTVDTADSVGSGSCDECMDCGGNGPLCAVGIGNMRGFLTEGNVGT